MSLPEYTRQFGLEDVLKKMAELHSLEGETKQNSLMAFHHELMSQLEHTFNRCDGLIELGTELDLFQRAYVQNISTSILHMKDIIDLLCYPSSDRLESKERSAGTMVHLLTVLSEYLPISRAFSGVAGLTEQTKKYMAHIDFFARNSFYKYNAAFSPSFQKASFLLNEDLAHYWVCQYAKTGQNGFVGFGKPRMDAISTKKNYFTNVILPLIDNMHQHAYTPENDVNGRLPSMNGAFSRNFNIKSSVNKEDKMITITVTDNGFGIRDELLPKVFERGFTTKKKVEDAFGSHGIGLWAVRNFVEAQGGKIWAESRLGEGTSFMFTVPYTSEEMDVYIQN